MLNEKQLIENGNAVIGIELGSTRIKAVLIDNKGTILATGGENWENHLIDGIWTYHQDEIWQKLQLAYADLAKTVKEKYKVILTQVKAIGVSAMMHGYLVFDKDGNQLVPFRTWRNNITLQSSQELTALFQYPIPQRWSIAHLHQALLNKESHLNQIDYLTTLSGYVHWQLTGERVLGIGDASGMFPIDTDRLDYNQAMLNQFDEHIKPYQLRWKINEILPKVLVAGQSAGKLTEQGVLLLDPTGNLQAGIPLCPPEGDAGTGMIATNCIKEKTGNISAGTSAFAMIVLEKSLSKRYPELDIVTTPAGKLVAMAHANNCTTEINAWVNLFGECLHLFGNKIQKEELFETLFLHALEGDLDCGNLLAYGFHSGEHNVGLSEGCPLFLHPVNGKFNLANFIRVQLYTAFGAMKLGMDILIEQEKVNITRILGHGGIFKTENVAQKILASALNTPLATMNTASNGGAWGIALLANYLNKDYANYTLENYLDQVIFKDIPMSLIQPEEEINEGYRRFMARYTQGIEIVKHITTLGI
ncbi:xylulokinase [Lonepinella koalarum]|uniref:Sugar (Pentulose or hexulose) kinase n=1 Tax=Lonepinella koalarum TaxID=53417 RepID=A0A4R1L008_9PAST|nr:FGGY-family carbohydrate kinase [Lonepinella koalarum]MDH2926043.1 ATPase [Lonepinella koalarum]TCK71195.1 sugar (pentulose or hexulose) kinase [Lonepinella koalarum]TFJ90921.1 ATPase [Lonepinella koalarum]